MRTEPIHTDLFYHEGRGPELQRTIWTRKGIVLSGFEYFNPDDEYTEANLKHLKLESVEAYAMSSEEVHGNILATGDSKAAIFKVLDSPWLASFNSSHLTECSHFQIMFYDEIYDVICKSIEPGAGSLNA